MTQIVRETKYHPVINGGKISLGSKKSSDVRFSASNLKKVTKKNKNQNVFWTSHVDSWSSKQNRHDKLTPRKMTINLMRGYLSIMIGSIFEIPYAQKVERCSRRGI